MISPGIHRIRQHHAIMRRGRIRFFWLIGVCSVLVSSFLLGSCSPSLIRVEAPGTRTENTFKNAPGYVPPHPSVKAPVTVPGISDAQLEDWLNRVLGRTPT